jgi:peptide/nickel transport system substrate-binding protein
MNRRQLMSAAAAAALLHPVSLRAQGAGAAGGGTLTMGVRSGPESIDPHWSTLGGHIEALRHVFDSLVAQDENLGLQPGLATSWRAVDDTTWEFKLREGVRFHDGSPFTAEDVKFSLERIPVVTGPMSMTLYTKRATGAQVVDPLTVRVTTNGPAPTLPNDFSRLMIVSHRIGMEPRNEQFNAGTAAIGTGPYKFTRWEPRGLPTSHRSAPAPGRRAAPSG